MEYQKGTWGNPIRNVTAVAKNKKGVIQRYFVENYGWISKIRAVQLATQGKIDNAIPVFPRIGTPIRKQA